MKKSMLILTLMVAALCGCAAQQPTTLETPESSVLVEVTPETSSEATPTATPAPTSDPTPFPLTLQQGVTSGGALTVPIQLTGQWRKTSTPCALQLVCQLLP